MCCTSRKLKTRLDKRRGRDDILKPEARQNKTSFYEESTNSGRAGGTSLLRRRRSLFRSFFFAVLVLPMASSTASRWLRPEVYPLFAAVGVAIGICGFSMFRNLRGNPEVRVNKESRAAGVLENFAEGQKYTEHSLRKFVRNKTPEIMPSINRFFADPK